MSYTLSKTLTFEEFLLQLIGEDYRQQQYRLGQSITSPLSPALKLCPDDILPR